MLIKKKKKKDALDKLEGLKFKHNSNSLIYTISKKSNETSFTVSWRNIELADYSGPTTTYSREVIVHNIETKAWVIVS